MRICLKPIDQQTIVITGASSGNGLATAEEAVARGAAVVLAARNLEALKEIAVRLRSGGGRVAVCAADVSDPPDIDRIAASAVAHFGGFDAWVNNAAAATYGTMEQVTPEDHRRIFDVNYFGVLHGSLVAARHLRSRGGGAIVNLGSVLSDRAMILQGPYSASKAAVQAATDALRMELERDGAPVSVTLIKPAAIHTPYPEHARNYMGAPPRLPPRSTTRAWSLTRSCSPARIRGGSFMSAAEVSRSRLPGASRRGSRTLPWRRWASGRSWRRTIPASRPGATTCTARERTEPSMARRTRRCERRASCCKRRSWAGRAQRASCDRA